MHTNTWPPHALSASTGLWCGTNLDAHHCALSSGSDRISCTRYAPWQGGLEYIARAIAFTWLSTAAASFALSHTIDSAPVRWPYMPMFFAYDCDSAIGMPLARKRWMAAPSASQSPVAKPCAPQLAGHFPVRARLVAAEVRGM